MTDIDIDAIRQQVERYTGFAGSSQQFLAHKLAKQVPALLAKVDELTAALAERDARVRQQRDGQAAVIEAAKAWRDVVTPPPWSAATPTAVALIAAVDALPKAEATR